MPLVQKYASDIGSTDYWDAGSRVMSVPNLARGTAIATFNGYGRYMSLTSGNHACFFIEFVGRDKIKVLEQNVGWNDGGRSDPHKIQTRTIKAGASGVCNDANAYSVVMVGTTSAKAELKRIISNRKLEH